MQWVSECPTKVKCCPNRPGLYTRLAGHAIQVAGHAIQARAQLASGRDLAELTAGPLWRRGWVGQAPPAPPSGQPGDAAVTAPRTGVA